MPVSEPDQQENNSLDAATVKHRAVSGAKVMSARTAISFVLRMISSLTLARLLFPRDYGAFGMVAGITGIAMVLGDIGLSGALMRQHSTPTEDENFTVFVSQQALTTLIVSGLLLSAPWLMQGYHMPKENYPLLVGMAFSLYLSSLRIIPMMFLERTLRFISIAQCELIENVVQVVSTIALAYLGLGAWSLVGGTILRGTTGLFCVWKASPWRPRGRFAWKIVRRLAHYGIPLQLNALIPALAGSWSTFAVSRLLGVTAVGLMGWAANMASVPMMFTGVLNRVAFPAYSRLQADPEMLTHYLDTTIKRLLALCCLIVPLAVILCPFVLPLLFKPRWIPAIPLVQWFVLESALGMLLGILCAVQNALGYPGDRLAVTLGMTLLRWTVGYLCVARFQLAAVGPAMLALTLFELLVTVSVLTARQKQFRSLFAIVFVPLSGIGSILAVALILGRALARESVILEAGVALLVFTICLTAWEWLAKESIVWRDVQRLIASLRAR